MYENEQIAAELKELEYNIAHLENEKQKGWLSMSKQKQLVEVRARRDQLLAKASRAVTMEQGIDVIRALKYLA